MANYYAGHEFFLQYATDSGVVNESTGAISSSFGSWVDLGYVDPANIASSEGTKKGFAAGSRTALYNAKGQRTHSLSTDLRLGSVSDLKSIYDNNVYYSLLWGVDNQWASRLRQAVLSTLNLNFTEGDAQEITASAAFEAIAREDGITPVNTNYAADQFGAVLFWQNVMTFSIGATSMRDSLMGLNVNVDNKIERKGIRPDWGDDAPMSRTPYGMMFHHKEITASLNFHSPLDSSTFFTGANNALGWGDIVLGCNDTSAGGSKTFNVTLTDVYPTQRTQQQVESGAQLQFGVEVVATNMTIALS